MSNKTEPLSTWVTPELLDDLKLATGEYDHTIAQAIRMGLKLYIEKYGKKRGKNGGS